MRVTRRAMIVAAAGAAGGLAVGLWWRRRRAGFDPGPALPGELNPWLVITPDDQVTIRVAKAEMGQGALTALAMIVAEELECRWEDVRVEPADVNRSVRNKALYGPFRTDGSTSVRGMRRTLQQVGAHARLCLLAAAAQRWGVPASECEAAGGQVMHRPSGRSWRYGELAAAAAQVSPPAGPLPLKRPGEFRLIGKATRALDTPLKVDGTLVYGIDLQLPRMVVAALLHAPLLGAKVRALDAATPPDGVSIFALEDAVVAVAPTYWRARAALAAARVTWDEGDAASVSTDALRASFQRALDEPAASALQRGDALAALGSGSHAFEARYDVPYLAHASMEPLTCTASVSAARVDIWVGTQDPEAVIAMAAKRLGVDAGRIWLHRLPMGGAFGRRVANDFVAQTLDIARRLDRPVKMIWSREQDMRCGMYRPMSACLLRATLAAGQPSALLVRAATDSIFARHQPGALDNGIDPTSTMGLVDTPYGWDHLRVESRNMSSPVASWFWRSVGDSQNAFAMESFIDELATSVGSDGLSVRRRLLQAQPRHLAVLAALEQKADLQERLPRGRGRGIALHRNARTIVGQAIDVEVSPDGELKVLRVIAVVDCSLVVNPVGAAHQIEGAIVFALSAALYGEISIEAGRVVQDNYDRYKVLRMRECPAIDVHFVPGGDDAWGGIGEPGVPPVAPALCNAIQRATGKRIRSLPIARHDLRWSATAGTT